MALDFHTSSVVQAMDRLCHFMTKSLAVRAGHLASDKQQLGVSMLIRVLHVSLAVLLLQVAQTTWAQKPPAWFGEPPRDTAETWYGAGTGPDPDAARRAALRTVAAKLRTAVEGEVENSTNYRNQGGKETIDIAARSRTIERVAKTEFGRVEIEASAKTAEGYAVLVKVDRPTFLRDTRGKLEAAAKPIADAERLRGNASTLEEFMALRRVNEQINEAISLSLLLTGAGAEAEGRAGFARYTDLLRRSQDVASRMVFELKFKPEDADIAKAVAGFLADQGMRSAASRTPGANALSIDTQSRQDELFGDKLMKLKVRFSVADEQGRAVASREHDVSGKSRYDFKGARESAVGRLNAAMREAGPLATFGFKE